MRLCIFAASGLVGVMRVEVSLEFEAWYRYEHPRLSAGLVVVAGSRAIAQEAADEAFVRALERWDRVSAMESPIGWTYRVALNLVKRHHRGRLRERRIVSLDESTVEDIGPPDEIWSHVTQLPPRQREAIVLRYLADLTESKIATAMGVRRGTVSSTLRDAHRNLKAVMPADEQESENA